MLEFYKVKSMQDKNGSYYIKVDNIAKDALLRYIQTYSSSYKISNELSVNNSNNDILSYLQKIPNIVKPVNVQNKTCSFAYWIELTPKTDISVTRFLVINGGLMQLKNWYKQNIGNDFDTWIKP